MSEEIGYLNITQYIHIFKHQSIYPFMFNLFFLLILLVLRNTHPRNLFEFSMSPHIKCCIASPVQRYTPVTPAPKAERRLKQ